MRTLLVLLVTAIAASSALGQNPKDDPGGWTKAKWNMTEARLKTIFPDLAPTMDQIMNQTEPGLRHYRIQGVPGSPYTVTFVMRGPGLASVYLTSELEGPPQTVAELSKIELLSALTDKYGKPSQETEERDHTGSEKKWEWIFPTTRIVLYWNHDSDPRFQKDDKTDLLYLRRDKNESGL